MICPKCEFQNLSIATFCSNCGHKLNISKEVDYNIPVKKISIFFFSLLAYICVLNFTAFGKTYSTLLIIDTIFAIIVLIFFFFNFKSTIRLFRFKKHSANTIILIVIIAPIMALIVYYLGHFLNKSIFDSSEIIYYNQFKNSPSPLFFSIISIGVFPAIFEEITFRGILFNQSLEIMGLKPTILVTSILFTILHLSLLSAIWLFPGALLLGYLRAKNKSIVYGIIGHFLYNTSIVIIQIVLT